MSDQKDRHANTAEEKDENFLSRWSRRKREGGEEEAAGPPAAVEPAETREDESVGDEPRVLTDDDMPSLDEIGEHSDYSGFLSPGVSEGLRRAALRKLFSSAKFNVCDGLDDYAEDYTKFLPLGDVITADMRHHMQRMLDKLADEEEAGEVEAPAALAQRDRPEGDRSDDTVDTDAGTGEASQEDDDDIGRA